MTPYQQTLHQLQAAPKTWLITGAKLVSDPNFVQFPGEALVKVPDKIGESASYSTRNSKCKNKEVISWKGL